MVSRGRPELAADARGARRGARGGIPAGDDRSGDDRRAHSSWDAYDDAADLASFEGKTWSELPAALLKRHAALPIYAGDALFCTTLPAFLRYLARERESFNDLPFQLAGQLTRRTDVDNKKLDRRRSRLTAAQRAVVGELLAYLATRGMTR